MPGDAAERMEAFCAALQPEIDDEGLAGFVQSVPEVINMPPAHVRMSEEEDQGSLELCPRYLGCF